MPDSRASRLTLLALLAAVMLATRVHHFSVLPDASWAVFFAAGFYLQAWTRWVFPALMVLAVAIDWIVIGNSGQSFWDHYCVSPGYAMLLPAHAALWLGGTVLAMQYRRSLQRALLTWLPCLIAAVALCHLFAQGGFYWLSDSWRAPGAPEPSLAGWWKNYLDWLPAYLKTTAIYVGVATLLHATAYLAVSPRASTRVDAR